MSNPRTTGLWPPKLLTNHTVRRKLLALRSRVPARQAAETRLRSFHPPTPLASRRYPIALYRPAKLYRRPGCPAPLTGASLHITPRWAMACFLPTYLRARRIYGDQHAVIANAIASTEGIPDAAPAAVELRRRIRLATAILMRSEGSLAPMPEQPDYARPGDADRNPQPWLRALLTGWA